MEEKILGLADKQNVKKVKDDGKSRNNLNCTSSYNCDFTYSSRYYSHVCDVR